MMNPKRRTTDSINTPKSVDSESSGSSSLSCANASLVPEQRFSERSTAAEAIPTITVRVVKTITTITTLTMRLATIVITL